MNGKTSVRSREPPTFRFCRSSFDRELGALPPWRKSAGVSQSVLPNALQALVSDSYFGRHFFGVVD